MIKKSNVALYRKSSYTAVYAVYIYFLIPSFIYGDLILFSLLFANCLLVIHKFVSVLQILQHVYNLFKHGFKIFFLNPVMK